MGVVLEVLLLHLQVQVVLLLLAAVVVVEAIHLLAQEVMEVPVVPVS